ncbi:MAG: 50S ribosomal protein L9 [Simkaniaceae bacterium]|jgi:large subunit ribosomal protein L9|nr:MAG: 50S ribosomal protein L9 [Simkaniaceae bacterium]
MNQKKSTKTKLLLLEDVTNLGKKGELASAKPGFVRNFLLPQKKAVIADKRTIRMQEQLKEEREVQAAQDKKDAEALAARLKDKTLTTKAKNDSQGHLYGSIATVDIVKILSEQEGLTIERKNVILPKPIKMVGIYDIELRLKENVPATFKLRVQGENKIQEVKTQVEVIDEEDEAQAEEAEGVSDEALDDLPMKSELEKEMKEELKERTKE